MNLAGKNILLLGASGVLGSALTEEFILRGANVYAVASNSTKAAAIPGAVALRLFADLEDKQSISNLTDYANQSLDIDAVVVASGVVGFGTAVNTTSSDAALLMQINHLGPAQVVAAMLPKLIQKPESFVASITGIVAEKTFAGMTAYCASKSAHSAWLQAIRQENKTKGLKVFEFRPGHTETGLAGRAIFGTEPNFPTGLDPKTVAAKMATAIDSDQEVVDSASF
jgi:cyclic-di-GMP-binding biofilm dispersal mediator protein